MYIHSSIIHLYSYLSIYPSVNRFINQSIYVSISQYLSLSIYLSFDNVKWKKTFVPFCRRFYANPQFFVFIDNFVDFLWWFIFEIVVFSLDEGWIKYWQNMCVKKKSLRVGRFYQSSIYLSFYLSIFLSTSLSNHLSIFLSINSSVYLYIYNSSITQFTSIIISQTPTVVSSAIRFIELKIIIHIMYNVRITPCSLLAVIQW